MLHIINHRYIFCHFQLGRDNIQGTRDTSQLQDLSCLIPKFSERMQQLLSFFFCSPTTASRTLSAYLLVVECELCALAPNTWSSKQHEIQYILEVQRIFIFLGQGRIVTQLERRAVLRCKKALYACFLATSLRSGICITYLKKALPTINLRLEDARVN